MSQNPNRNYIEDMSESILRNSMVLNSTSVGLLEDFMLMEYESIQLTSNIDMDTTNYSVLENEMFESLEHKETILRDFIRRNKVGINKVFNLYQREFNFIKLVIDEAILQLQSSYWEFYTDPIVTNLFNITIRLTGARFKQILLYGMLYGFPSNNGRTKIKFEPLAKYITLRNCKCNRCNIYFKRDALVKDPTDEMFKICKSNCTNEAYRRVQEIPECIGRLTKLEKYTLRIIRIFCRNSRPQRTRYYRFMGRPNLSLQLNVWEDLSGLLAFDNDYNAFARHSSENVVQALTWLRDNNYFYRMITNGMIEDFLSNYNINRNLIDTEDQIENLSHFHTRPRNIDQEAYANQDAQFGVIPVAEMITSEGVDVRNFSYREKESGLFPFLFPNGCNQDFPSEEKYAMRIKNLCFHYDPRFRNCWSWIFYHFDTTEYHRISYNNRRLIREEYANNQNTITVSDVLDESRYHNRNIYDDNVTTTLPTSIRGAPPYLKKRRGDTFAAIKELGPPNLFLTFSCDESNWLSCNSYLNHFGTLDTGSTLPVHIQNPWLANHFCYERLLAMCKYIMRNGYQGYRVTHYFRRFEFQNRGTVHMHLILWLLDSSLESLLAGIKAELPDPNEEPLLYWLVRKYQYHQCSENYCLRNGTCRFYFPKPVSDVSFYDAMNDNFVLKRNSNETRINAYHKPFSEVWRGNMDIKIVTNENVAFYMTKYMTKDEPFEVMEEGNNYARRYLEIRNYSIHEICHYTMGNQIAAFDVKIVAIPLCFSLINRRTLRPVNQIEELDDGDLDIFYDNAIDKYCNRHDSLENLTIVQFFQQYQIASHSYRGATIVDRDDRIWKFCDPNLIVRIYPYYTEWSADKYYAQVILKLNPFRNANELLESCLPWRNYVQTNHFQSIIADTNFDNDHQEDLIHTDLYPDDLYTRLVNMYNLTLQQFRPVLSDLNENQYSIFNSILSSTSRFHLVTGGPGTGKTYLLRTMVYALMRQGKVTKVSTSTGVAAYLIGGSTIHSFLRITKINEQWVSPLSNNPHTIRDVDYLIIDEFSMIGQTLFELVMLILNKNITRHIIIILFGDPLQLPAVRDNPISVSSWFSYFIHHRLTTSQRSADPVLLEIISNFYERTPTVMINLLNFINSRLIQTNELDEPYVFAKRWECNSFNSNRLSTLDNRVHTFKYFDVTNNQIPVSNFPLAPESIKKQFRYLPELKICLNCKVMLLVNLNVNEGLVNGSFGTVRAIRQTDTEQEVDVEFASGDGPILVTMRPKREQIEDWILYQIPITPAYATTVHKVQGLTLEKIIVGDLKSFWVPEQLYVAISRVRSHQAIKFLKSYNRRTNSYEPYSIQDLNALFYREN